jgi:hypothetical protein
MLAHQDEVFRKRLAEIRQLPLEQRDAALNRLQRDEEAWQRDISNELDREARDLDREQTLGAQRDLTDAINDLSNQIEETRTGY